MLFSGIVRKKFHTFLVNYKIKWIWMSLHQSGKSQVSFVNVLNKKQICPFKEKVTDPNVILILAKKKM